MKFLKKFNKSIHVRVLENNVEPVNNVFVTIIGNTYLITEYRFIICLCVKKKTGLAFYK